MQNLIFIDLIEDFQPSLNSVVLKRTQNVSTWISNSLLDINPPSPSYWSSCSCLLEEAGQKEKKKEKLKGIPGTMFDQKGMPKFKSYPKSDQLFTLGSVYRRLSSHCWNETNIASSALICGRRGFPILAQWWHLRGKEITLFSFQPFNHDKDLKNSSGQYELGPTQEISSLIKSPSFYTAGYLQKYK